MTDEMQLTLRIGLIAGLIALAVVIPNRASGSSVRNALVAFVLFVSFFSFCALLVEAVADVSLYAVPVSAVAIAALLFLVIEPKISTRLRAIFPDRRRIRGVVRVLGSYVALAVYLFVMLQLPVAIFAAFTLAAGLLALGSLLVILSRSSGPPTNRREQRRRLGGFALVVLGMIMTFGGSFGASFLFDIDEIATGESGTWETVLFYILFGPVYYLGLPVFLLGLWLLGIIRRRG